MQNITINGLHLPTLAKIARELGSPTDDAFAEYLWRLSNYLQPVEYAVQLMQEAGYKPFAGFPLQRRVI